MKVVLMPGFLRSVKRCSSDLQGRIADCLFMLEQDPFQPALRTHRLRGSLSAFFSCSVTQSYRIIFTLEDQCVVIRQAGNHDDVY